jgi:hypothetical protein
LASAGYQGLPHLPENSPDLRAAHFNLRNIRIALARPDFRPRESFVAR